MAGHFFNLEQRLVRSGPLRPADISAYHYYLMGRLRQHPHLLYFRMLTGIAAGRPEAVRKVTKNSMSAIPVKSRMPVLVTVALAVASIGVALSISAFGVRHRPAVSAATMARLQSIARKAALVNRDRNPGGTVAVATTGREALHLATPGASMMPGVANKPVYLVSMTGHFKGYGLYYPSPAAVPTGTVLDIVVAAASFRVYAMSLRTEPTDVRAAGTPFRLSWK
jgi:hypothetical protein